jgi:hypothetical protein
MESIGVPFSYIAAASANQDSQVVKAAPGRLRGLSLHNVAATLRYVKIYDKATAPTSADTPAMRFPLTADGGGMAREYGAGIPFGAGIAVRIAAGIADNDATAVTAGDVVVNIEYA